jgi:Cell morphogenesis central region
MTELLCVEVMTRQLQASAAVHQHAVLAALAPWMDNLSFAARWEGAALSLLQNGMRFATCLRLFTCVLRSRSTRLTSCDPAGNWSERLLKSMYYVTLRHANAFPRQVRPDVCCLAMADVCCRLMLDQRGWNVFALASSQVGLKRMLAGGATVDKRGAEPPQRGAGAGLSHRTGRPGVQHLRRSPGAGSFTCNLMSL